MQRCFDIHLWISVTPNAAVLFVDVAIQPEVRFIAKQNSLMKIGNNGNLVLGPFDESTPCLMIVLMNCQTKLRINHFPAVKSVAILENVIKRFMDKTREIPGEEREICSYSLPRKTVMALFRGVTEYGVLIRRMPAERLQPCCLQPRHIGPTLEVLGEQFPMIAGTLL
ncbi:adhesion G protein-coupled receptor B2 [Trichonephila clavipes]|nr:adhesion G protein-coupled receptor B2 [Trichonephila clavipes]